MPQATGIRRRHYIDTACGLLILHMILGHCFIFSGFSLVYQKFTLIIDFFMPWFFFKSGMFFSDKPIRKAIIGIWHRLIIPYIAFSLIALAMGLLVECIICRVSSIGLYLSAQADNVINDGAVVWEASLWFLTSLAAVKLIYLLCLRLGKCGYAVILMICLAGVYIDGFVGLNAVPLYVRNIPLGLIFYALGHILKNTCNIGKYSALVITASYVLLLGICPTYLDFHKGLLMFGSYWLYFPLTLMGIISINSLFRNYYDRPCLLSRIGCDSITYYILHWPIIMTVKYAFVYIGLPTDKSVVCIIALLCAEAALLPIMASLIHRFGLNMLLGKK